MTSAGPVLALTGSNLKTWFSAKGFILVAVAALLPLGLTGAWVATNQADVEVTSLTWDEDALLSDTNVTFTAVVENVGDTHVDTFNATLNVGRVQGASFMRADGEDVRIESLAPGESREITFTWTARAGPWSVLAFADQADEVGEVDEVNNQVVEGLAVHPRLPGPEDAPRARENLTGSPDSNATGDAAVVSVTWPENLESGENATFTATFVNHGPDPLPSAAIFLNVGQSFEGEMTPIPALSDSRFETLEPGQEVELQVTWTDVQSGAFWAEAYVEVPPGDGHDPDAENNHHTEAFTVSPVPPERLPDPPEKATVKSFYVMILQFLHLMILVPFIALFYAGGVITDERARGTLPYILSRPLPRWLIPLGKFAAGFVVAGTALVAGVVLTYFLLLGYPQGGDVGFLTTPLLITVLTLFVYGAFFTLLGVLANRPYLIGVAIVLGWETVAGMFLPWVEKLTLRYHIQQAIVGWPMDEGFVFLPQEAEAARNLGILVLVALGFLAAAAYAMKKREFDV